MKSGKIDVTVRKKGLIVIPEATRKKMKINDGDIISITIETAEARKP